MPGSGRAPWVTGKGGWITFTSLSTGGVELLRDAKAIFFNCFALQNFENDKYIRNVFTSVVEDVGSRFTY